MTTAQALVDYALALVNRQPPLLYGQRAINGLPQRGPDSYDCIGFTRQCLLTIAPELWPTSWGGPDSWTVPNFLAAWRAHGLPIDTGTPLPGDLLVWSDAAGPQHIGIAQDATWYLSALNTVSNVCRSSIAASTVHGRSMVVLRCGLVQLPAPNFTPRTAVTYTPINPTRLIDSRVSGGRLAAHSPRIVPVTGGVVPVGAIAITGNLTITRPDAAGWAAITPTPGTPTTSAINFVAGQTVANGFSIGLAPDGSVAVYSIAAADFIVDVTGYFEGAIA